MFQANKKDTRMTPLIRSGIFFVYSHLFRRSSVFMLTLNTFHKFFTVPPFNFELVFVC